MKRKSEYRDIQKGYIDMINHNKDMPIRESKAEKKEYIRKELNELAMSENGWDKIRYKCLLKSVS